MDLKEAADALGCSIKSVRRYIKAGKLEARKLKGQSGQTWDIPLSSLEAFKDRKPEVTAFPTFEPNKQPGKALATVDTQGHLALDIGHGLVGHPENFKLGRLGTTLNELPDICNIQEAAIYLTVSPQKVREFIRIGKLQGVKLGRGLKVSKYSLELFRKKLFGR